MTNPSDPLATASSSRSPPKSPTDGSRSKGGGRKGLKDSRSTRDVEEANEESPLLAPSRSSQEDEDEGKISPLNSEELSFPLEEHVSRSSWYMFLLTLGAFG